VESSPSAWSARPASKAVNQRRAGELIRRQLGNGFSDLFDFHVAEDSTDAASLPTSSATTRVPPEAFWSLIRILLI
jgi:hypothetical protein